MDTPPPSDLDDDDIIDGDPPSDPPQAALPSAWLFRGSLAALGIASALAVFLLVSPPQSEGRAEPTRSFATATRQASATATATQQGAVQTVTVTLPTATPTLTPTATVATGERSHSIVSGDTLSGLAEQFGTTVPAILALNPGLTADNISIGDTIRIPAAQ